MRPLCPSLLLPLLTSCPLLLAAACTPDAGAGAGAAGSTDTGTGMGATNAAPTNDDNDDDDDGSGMTAADSESSGGTAAVCGNGTVDTGEACDDSGESALCNDDCTAASCGDAITNVSAGEECDDASNGNNDDGCTDACLSPVCGDGMTQLSLGEECDDSGNSASCNEACVLKTWGEPTLLGPHTNTDGFPLVLTHGNGNTMVFWRTRTAAASVEFAAARYDAAKDSWGELVLLPGISEFGFPDAAMDDDENVIVVWSDNAAPRNAYVTRYDAAADTWSGAQLLETEYEGTSRPNVSVAPNGDAVATWAQQNGPNGANIYASRYTTATNTWAPREPLQITTDMSNITAVATDDTGNAIVIWGMLDGPWYSAYASRYSVQDGDWSDPVALESGGLGDTSAAEVAIDGAGNAIAVWQKSDGTRDNLHTARYDESTDTWGDAELLENDDLGAGVSRIAFDSQGNAIATWYHGRDTVAYGRAKHYDTQTASWGSVVSLCEDCIVAALAVGPTGDAAVGVTAIVGADIHAQAMRYDAGAGRWGAAQALEMSDERALFPNIGIADNGDLVAAWRQEDGEDANAMASVFN